MQHVMPMQVTWPIETSEKEQYLVVTSASMSLLVANKDYVLLRRFSAKEERRRLIAAPFLGSMMDSPFVGLENHLNYVHRPGSSLSDEETYGLAALFNSALLDTYFRTCNGNTQVSATELRAMPLPSLEEMREIGKRIMSSCDANRRIDTIIEDVLGIHNHGIQMNEIAYAKN
jgi:adenine-specific DNA-methyltransferase